eukprot:566442-Pelagomonas_calceolata.AAC.14
MSLYKLIKKHNEIIHSTCERKNHRWGPTCQRLKRVKPASVDFSIPARMLFGTGDEWGLLRQSLSVAKKGNTTALKKHCLGGFLHPCQAQWRSMTHNHTSMGFGAPVTHDYSRWRSTGFSIPVSQLLCTGDERNTLVRYLLVVTQDYSRSRLQNIASMGSSIPVSLLLCTGYECGALKVLAGG